nr:hypothetical protein CFP56_24099 [Quercus suber]
MYCIRSDSARSLPLRNCSSAVAVARSEYWTSSTNRRREHYSTVDRRSSAQTGNIKLAGHLGDAWRYGAEHRPFSCRQREASIPS